MNDHNSSNNFKRENLGHFILGKTLGEGTFGKVKIATHITTGEKVKYFSKYKINFISIVIHIFLNRINNILYATKLLFIII